MRIAVIQFPTALNEQEILLAVERAGMEPKLIGWHDAFSVIEDFAGYIIVGGFPTAEAICARIVGTFDPLIQALKKQSELAKPILGIGQGAQILVESGLVPGIEGDRVGMALTQNKLVQENIVEGEFSHTWVHVRLSEEYQRNAFTTHLNLKDILSIPITHSDSHFIMGGGLLREIQIQGLSIFQYCDEQGQVTEVNNIAAVANKTGNVLALALHPERTMNGNAIFDSMRDYIQQGFLQKVDPLYFLPRPYKIKPYKLNENAQQLLINTVRASQQALVVEELLHRLGIMVKIKCYEHWEVQDSGMIDPTVVGTHLFHAPQEFLVSTLETPSENIVTYLVRAKEDIVAQHKLALLGESKTLILKSGLVWQIMADANQLVDFSLAELASVILFNAAVEDCYEFSLE